MAINFIPGETLYTIGINMACKRVVVKVVFVRLHTDGRVITESRGIKVIGGAPTEYFRSKADAGRLFRSRKGD